MSHTVRVIVLNTDESVANDLRAVLLGIPGVKIVAEIDEPGLLNQALTQFPAELLLCHLDPNAQAMMEVVAPLIERHKDNIAAIAMTEDRDAELVMKAMRAGMKEFLWKPFPPEQLAEILNRVGQESVDGGRRLGRLLTVVGTGGGVGATQLTVNLGAELSQLEDEWAGEGHPKVALVDLDLRFGQVAMQLDAAPNYTIAELCETGEAIDTGMIERAMYKHPTGLHILTRPNDFSQAEQISAGHCASVISALQEHYDFVIVDVPARFDPTARAVYDMADVVLLVLQLLVPSVRTADRVLQHFAATGYAGDRIRMVCNRAGRDAGYLEQGDVETTLKRKMDFTIPDDWRTSSGAVNIGSPLHLHAPKAKLRLAYRQVALALAGGGLPVSVTEGEAGKKGLFGFFAGAKA